MEFLMQLNLSTATTVRSRDSCSNPSFSTMSTYYKFLSPHRYFFEVIQPEESSGSFLRRKRKNIHHKVVKLISAGDWKELITYMDSRKGFNVCKKSCYFVLSLLLAHGSAPINTIKKILDIDPSVVHQTTDEKTRASPLHISCLKGTTVEVIKCILSTSSKQSSENKAGDNHVGIDGDDDYGRYDLALATKPDRKGRTPLHHAVVHACLQDHLVDTSSRGTEKEVQDDAMEVIRFLCSIAPNCLNVTDKNGFTPIDLSQNIKCLASRLTNPRFIRSHDVYVVLRDYAISFYRSEKLKAEMKGVIIS